MIYDLRTEYAVQPMFIDTPRPRFSWKWQGTGLMQTDYRIIVRASSGNQLWDSKKVSSSKSVGVEYDGEPLESFCQYSVRVEVNSGLYSSETSFETALLSPSEMTAEWIGMPYLSSGSTLLVRRVIDVPAEKTVKRARAYVAGLGCHRIYLNGESASDEYFNPQVSVYGKRIYYTVYPLSLRSGKNVLGIELGHGWYPMLTLWAQILVEYSDGTRTIVRTEHGWDWKCKQGSVTENSIYGGETYDARLEDKNWCAITADDEIENGWIFSCRTEKPAGQLCAQSAEGMRVSETLAVVCWRKIAADLTRLDFGRNICGRVNIVVRGKKGSRIVLRFAESVDDDGGLLRQNLRAARAEDIYILKGDEEERFAPEFTYHGFRYVEVEIDGDAELLSAIAEQMRSGVAQVGRFNCSDEEINRLHDMAVLTESNNLNGVFTDCPQRDERFGWLNDMTPRIYQSICNFDYSRFLPSFIRAISDEQREDGAIADTIPYIIGGCPADPVSAYPQLGLIAYSVYGDTHVLSENYFGFCKWFEYLSRRLSDGVLLDGVYGDWVPAAIFSVDGGESPFSAHVTPQFVSGAYYVWYANIMSKIATALNKSEDALRYNEIYRIAKAKFHEKYYNSLLGVYGGGGQTECAVVATAFGDAALSEKLMTRANADVIEKKYHTTCGNQGYFHLFFRMAEAGFSDTMIRLLKNPEYPGWGYMLKKGATTVWERWEDEMQSKMHSFNHPMFATYDAFFYNYLVGIRVNECEDAFGKIVIEIPRTELLMFASASLETVRGKISCEWERRDGQINITIHTPANTRLVLRAEGMLEVNGESIAPCDQTELLNGTFKIKCNVRERWLNAI